MIWNRFFAIRSQGTNVNLTDNPIFLTQKRLGHRAGVLAAILIATLIGASLLSGLVAYLIKPIDFDFRTPQEAGELFYSWIIGIEILMVVLGGFGRICQSLANERKAGLWDSNRLTPLKPCELIFGYWFGSPLREFYMGAVMAGFGLLTVLLSHLPITLWLGTQILIASTALFVGLAAFFLGLVFSRPQAGLMVVALIFLFPLAAAAPNRLLTNFLLPIYGIVHLFYNGIDARYEAIGWHRNAEYFRGSCSGNRTDAWIAVGGGDFSMVGHYPQDCQSFSHVTLSLGSHRVVCDHGVDAIWSYLGSVARIFSADEDLEWFRQYHASSGLLWHVAAWSGNTCL